MSYTTLAVNLDGAYSVSGGTPVEFTIRKNTGDLVEHHAPADAFMTRRWIRSLTKAPRPNPSLPNGVTQVHNGVVFHFPILLANGKYTTNKAGLTLDFDPETSDADKLKMLKALAWFAGISTDGQDFLKNSDSA